MTMKLNKYWHAFLKEELNKPYIQELKEFLAKERASGQVVYPPEHLVFSAFSFVQPDEVKVVIVGQDPYHGKGQAHGLSFSVPQGVRPPPSLLNIFKEIQDDLQLPLPRSGHLVDWAKQGVLMLNATLTVRAGQPKSHYGKGWERFTDAVIAELAKREKPLIFLLWGRSAKDKCAHLLEHTHHIILTAAHPSPYAAAHGFFGCRHFSKANDHLKQWGETPVDWSIKSEPL